MAVESIKITNTDTDPDPDLSLVLSCKRRKEDDVEEDPKEYPILSPYSKRRRLEEEEPDPDDSTQLPEFIKIEELPDAVLFEILYRLPCRWALQCKSVSKRWCSVISHPSFVRNAMLHRHPFSKSNTDPFTLVLYHGKKILALPFDEDCGGVGDGDGAGDGLDFLNFLPCIEFARKNYPFCVEASFNDLLLIRSEVPPIVNSGFTEYCICNPITKQWIILPRLPYQGYRGIVLVGFICIPDSCDKEQGCITNAHYSYRVVRIYSPTPSNTTQIRMQIFSSDTGEWCDSLVSSPRGFNSFVGRPEHAGVVACNGMLLWVDVDKNDRMIRGFVVFDPFNNAQGCRYIDPPIDLSLREWVSFGVFQGRLRIFQNSSLQCPRSFSVWELEDYNNAGTWCLKYKIYFKDMVSEYSDLLKISTGSFLAFHPNVGEIVFLQFRKYIVLCNMRTRVLTMASRLEKLLPCKSIYSSASIAAKYVFLVGQPSWPTPVPLPLKFECPSPFLISEFVSKRQKQKKQRKEIEKLRATPTPILLG